MRHWVKLWIDILSDYKISTLSDSAFRVFIECLALAGEHGNGDNEGLLPDVKQMAWRLRRQEEDLIALLDVLVIAGLVDKHNNEYKVTAFSKRQSALSNAERQKLYRERQKSNLNNNTNSNTKLQPLKSNNKNKNNKSKRKRKNASSKINQLLENLK
jgi:hypothetical protein